MQCTQLLAVGVSPVPWVARAPIAVLVPELSRAKMGNAPLSAVSWAVPVLMLAIVQET